MNNPETVLKFCDVCNRETKHAEYPHYVPWQEDEVLESIEYCCIECEEGIKIERC